MEDDAQGPPTGTIRLCYCGVTVWEDKDGTKSEFFGRLDDLVSPVVHHCFESMSTPVPIKSKPVQQGEPVPPVVARSRTSPLDSVQPIQIRRRSITDL